MSIFFFQFFRKKRPSVTITAKKSREPMTVPAMALIGVVTGASDLPVCVDPADDWEVEVDVWLGDDEVLVGCNVDDGELPLMHEESSLAPTILMSDAPPCAPRASVIINIIEVPAATFATQL